MTNLSSSFIENWKKYVNKLISMLNKCNSVGILTLHFNMLHLNKFYKYLEDFTEFYKIIDDVINEIKKHDKYVDLEKAYYYFTTVFKHGSLKELVQNKKLKKVKICSGFVYFIFEDQVTVPVCIMDQDIRGFTLMVMSLFREIDCFCSDLHISLDEEIERIKKAKQFDKEMKKNVSSN